MKARTIHTEQIWQSSDGNRKIWEVKLAADNGEQYTMKTYSLTISKMGFYGELKSYLTDRGERFVRQQTAAKPAYTRDDNAIRAQWAIGQAINLASVKMDKEAITMPVIEEYARELFATVSRVKGDDVTPELEAAAAKAVKSLVTAPSMF